MKLLELRKLSVCVCVSWVALFSASMAYGQNQNSNTSSADSSATSGKPKDVVTRAKLHTELGALYFQSGNLIVALEELTIATSINPDYAPAYSTRGLVLYLRQPKAISSVRWTLPKTTPRSTTTTDGFFARRARSASRFRTLKRQ